jgi:hypothetical protein
VATLRRLAAGVGILHELTAGGCGSVGMVVGTSAQASGDVGDRVFYRYASETERARTMPS